MSKSSDGNDNGKEFHIRFNPFERKIIEAMKAKYGVSGCGAVRMSLRAAARDLGFKFAQLEQEIVP